MGFTGKQMKILDTAEALFSARGFDGTSVRDIAEASDVNVAMISYYFGSKDKLMHCLVQRRTESVSVKIDSLLADDSLSPFEKLDSLVDHYIEKTVEKHQFYKLMISEHSLGQNADLTKLIRDMKAQNAASITRLIEDGQKKKVFKKDVDVLLMMNTLFGTCIHTFNTMDFYKDYYGLKTHSKEELRELVRKRLGKYVKELFKATLST